MAAPNSTTSVMTARAVRIAACSFILSAQRPDVQLRAPQLSSERSIEGPPGATVSLTTSARRPRRSAPR
jgi:hypothetical protein